MAPEKAAGPNERLTLHDDLRHFLTVRGREVRGKEVATAAA